MAGRRGGSRGHGRVWKRTARLSSFVGYAHVLVYSSGSSKTYQSRTTRRSDACIIYSTEQTHILDIQGHTHTHKHVTTPYSFQMKREADVQKWRRSAGRAIKLDDDRHDQIRCHPSSNQCEQAANEWDDAIPGGGMRGKVVSHRSLRKSPA